METPIIFPQSGGVSFSRKVQVRDYESAEASIWLSFDLTRPDGMDDDEYTSHVMSLARDAFFSAKGLVYEELGLEFSVSENGIIQESLKRHFGNVTEVKNSGPTYGGPAPAAPVPSGEEVGPVPPHNAETTDKAEKAANKAWALARWSTHPNEFWDNRTSKRSPKAPDLKHKDTGLPVWLN